MDLTGKIIVATGAASGIGKATALACAQAGADLLLTDIVADKLEATVAGIEAMGAAGRVLGIAADLREEAEVTALFDRAAADFGRIDGVFANAGITGNRLPATELDFASWNEVMAINLHGTFHTVMAGARRLVAQGGGGSIVISGSSQGVRPLPGFIAYAASKGALHNLAQSLAFELAAHRIRVNVLVPGTTNTELVRAMPGHGERVAKTFPLGELAEPEELAQFVVFAMSDLAPHMTGTLLKIDSGRLI
ncbi:MAG: SDR family NAD(P)-dependent oxidoreductase [Alphaproteobacteria bacterium]|jgi:NAD(P)-dependent dehydrogenase (short-subunit alcohol dehydrogenase family)